MPNIQRPISKSQHSLIILPPIIILPLVLRAIRPCLLPFPFLLIIPPVSFIHRAIRMLIHSIPIRFIINPFAFINIPIPMNQFPFTKRFILCSLAYVFTPIRPYLCPLAISLCIPSFPLVD